MLKINILSPGRFQTVDMARELHRLGYDVRYYSFVPNEQAMKYGLPRECCRSHRLWLAPFLVLERRLFKGKEWSKRLRVRMEDLITAWMMRKCDLCIAMSGTFLHAVGKARKQGAKIIIERASMHIEEQYALLDTIKTIGGKNPVSQGDVERELKSYQQADYISVPSIHVYNSFRLHGYPEQQLLLNPFGADLSFFKPDSSVKKEFDVVMIGLWCYRKGCDLIEEAIRKTGFSFLHIGNIIDLPFPEGPLFTQVGQVSFAELKQYYNKAKVFLLPSREEGLALVQAQAISMGLPVVGSMNSGAVDLRNMVDNPEYVVIIKDFTAEAVAEALHQAMMKCQEGVSDYLGSGVEKMTWTAYGERYAENIKKVMASLSE